MGMIRAKKEIIELLRQLAEQDMRSLSAETAWLIRREWDRRFSLQKNEEVIESNSNIDDKSK
jgi:hypothetical protein